MLLQLGHVASEPSRHKTPFSWLWLLVAGKGRQLLSVFNQIPFDIYPFLTPGLQQVPSCQFKLGYVSVTLWMLWMRQLSLVGIMQGHLSFPVTEPEMPTTALPWDHSHRLSPALPAGRGDGSCGYHQTSELEAGFQAKSPSLNFSRNETRTNTCKWNCQFLLMLKPAALPALHVKHVEAPREPVFQCLHWFGLSLEPHESENRRMPFVLKSRVILKPSVFACWMLKDSKRAA